MKKLPIVIIATLMVIAVTLTFLATQVRKITSYKFEKFSEAGESLSVTEFRISGRLTEVKITPTSISRYTATINFQDNKPRLMTFNGSTGSRDIFEIGKIMGSYEK